MPPPLPPHLLLRAVSEGPPGAQVASLYDAADDGTNEAGWGEGAGGDAFRVAVVVTGSRFADTAGFDPLVSCAEDTTQFCSSHTRVFGGPAE